MKSKQNKTLSKFVDYKRFTFVIPIILLALALLVFAIWGVNKGVDYQDSYTYNIFFNTSVTSAEYKNYTKIVKDTIREESNGDFTVVVSKINEDITAGCKVNVINKSNLSDASFEEKLNSINESIKTQLDAQNTTRTVRISDLQFQKAESYSKPLVMGLVSLLVVMAVMFAYFWIRFELKMALGSLIIAPYSAVSVLSLLVLFRIPFTYNFMLPVAFATILAYIFYLMIFANIRTKLLEKNNLTNAGMVYDSIANNKTAFIVFVAGLAGVLVLLMLVLNITYITLLISLLFAMICAIYSGVVLATTMWCEIYKKENDNRLKSRLELMAKREEKEKQPKVKDAQLQEENNLN